MKVQRRNTGIVQPSPILSARWGQVVNSMTWLLYPQRDPVPTVEEDGWAPRPVWTNVENRKYLNPTAV